MLAVSPGLSAADFYLYPDRIELDARCDMPIEVLTAVEAENSDPEYGEAGKAKAAAGVDLNGDGRCEIMLTPPRIYLGTGYPFTTVMIEREGNRVSIGDFVGGPDGWWYGVPRNGYARIFVPTNVGHRTNPEFSTAVYAFDGEKYVLESGKTATHGYHLDAGLRAYRSGDFATAEKHYKNAYRMNQEPTLADANNLALVWSKQGKLDEAKALLEHHLLDEADSDQLAAAYFNLGLIEERKGNRAAALHDFTRAYEIAPTRARDEKLRELGAERPR